MSEKIKAARTGAGASNPETLTSSVAASAADRYESHDDYDVTIIWQNIDIRSNFIMFRKESTGPIERILMDFATVLKSGVIDEVISVNASKQLFCVTLATEKNKEDGVMDQISKVR